MLELHGDEGVTLYRLCFHGGPDDGLVAHSWRPYDRIRNRERIVYAAEQRGNACLVWVDDFTREIHLNYVGPMTDAEFHERGE